MAGELQYRPSDGKLLHLSSGPLQAECCCPEPCTCDLYLPWSYSIADYADGDIVTCPTCPAGEANDSIWNGQFHVWDHCQWTIGYSWPYKMKMNGRKLARVHVGLASPTLCRWELSIYCGLYQEQETLVWLGHKNGGHTPAGNYQRADGCSEIETLTIVPSW